MVYEGELLRLFEDERVQLYGKQKNQSILILQENDKTTAVSHGILCDIAGIRGTDPCGTDFGSCHVHQQRIRLKYDAVFRRRCYLLFITDTGLRLLSE